VKWSATVNALVAAGVVTVASVTPAPPAGMVATIVVAFVTVKVADAPPKCTAVAPVKFVPLMVTEPPPLVAADAGLRPVMTGVGRFTIIWTLPTPITALAPGMKAAVPFSGDSIALMIAKRTVVPAMPLTSRLPEVPAVSVASLAPGTISRLPPRNTSWKSGTEVTGYKPTKMAVSLLERPPISLIPVSIVITAVVAPAGMATS
jgi:hypothetical protein